MNPISSTKLLLIIRMVRLKLFEVDPKSQQLDIPSSFWTQERLDVENTHRIFLIMSIFDFTMNLI